MADIRAYFPPSRALVLKTPVVALAIVAGAIGAYAAGWYGAAWLAGETPVGFLGRFPSRPVPGHLIALAGALVTPAATWVIGRIARRALFAAIPIFTCFALLLGVWNGYASGFDSEYLRALTHHWANADALRHMRPSDATLACADARMKLTQDARDLCREGEAGASAAPE